MKMVLRPLTRRINLVNHFRYGNMMVHVEKRNMLFDMFAM